jgi:hypothetical protein
MLRRSRKFGLSYFISSDDREIGMIIWGSTDGFFSSACDAVGAVLNLVMNYWVL